MNPEHVRQVSVEATLCLAVIALWTGVIVGHAMGRSKRAIDLAAMTIENKLMKGLLLRRLQPFTEQERHQ